MSRTDLDGRLPIVYNGKSAEEWYTLYCQEAMKNDNLPMPKIKPLVWVQTGTRHRIAITPMGAFEVWKCVGEEAWKGFFQGQQEYKFCSEEEAKATCEAEYERRVRECLE